MNNIIPFLHQLRQYSGAIWLENDAIKLSTSKELQTEETRNFIVQHKAHLIAVLKENKIYSKETFLNTLILKDNSSAVYPLSPAQERLWFIEQYEQGSNAYHIPAVYELDAAADTAGMKYALQQIVNRHEVLRTTIEQDETGDRGIQRVHTEPLSFEEITLTHTDDFDGLVQEDINHPFDLSAEYPIRIKFYTLLPAGTTPNEAPRVLLLVNVHHIASDGWSAEIFESELFAYYDAYTRNDMAFALPPLEIQYKDYAVWQRAYLTGEVLEQQLNYWKEKLTGFQTLELPTDFPRPSETDYTGASLGFNLGEETSEQLRTLAQRFGVTLHSVLLSSVNILMSKYSGQDDIVIGSVIANRHHRQTESLIGFFVNTQVHRTILNPAQSFEELVQQVQHDQEEAQRYQDLPFEKLVDELEVERDTSRHPVFQVTCEVQSAAAGSGKASGEQKACLKPADEEVAYEIEKFDLSVLMEDNGDELIGQVSYATALFSEHTIERMIAHFTHLLRQLAATPALPYSQISLLEPEEYNQVVHEWNNTCKDYSQHKTMHQLFGETARQFPGHTALVFNEQQLTYRQLNEKTNQLARYIREQYQLQTGQPLLPDTFIALYLERSLEMIISILAILKAGGAYVPLDTTYSGERINYILEDTQAALVLCQKQLLENSGLQLPAEKVIYTDLSESLYQTTDKADLPQHSQPEDLAYLIYTSGSTGQPKAVAVEHHTVVNMALGRVDEYQMTPAENSLQIASVCFDASVEQIFVPLFCGARLTLIQKELLGDSEQCELFFNEHRITHLDTVPSFLETLDFSKLKYLSRIASGGEACTADLVNRILPYIEFYNEYGPTEATVICTQYKIEKGETVSGSIPIGKPVANTKLYILDHQLQPVPAGITGEIYIGGNCLARGYLNSNELTAEKFIANPYGPGRLYKTGDWGRWLKNGQVEYQGRKDQQIKIRGFRIELGEIEHALSQIEGIKQCCVLAKERKTAGGSNKYLVAYYILNNKDSGITQNSITEKLSQTLPEYMVPAMLVAMESFPVTINGKLDKRSLPDPDFSDGDNYIKPGNELEVKLCTIYAEVLGLPAEQISTHQNFFKMGGNSILSIRLKVKLNKLPEFKTISVADLFKYNSISKLIQSLEKSEQTEYIQHRDVVQKNSHEIAIIGASGAFSGANNITEFWQLISEQQEGLRFFTADECAELGVEESSMEEPGFVPVSGQIEGMEWFDPLFWELSPNEAKVMDPQIRKFIEHCWYALESSGYAHQRKKHHIGIFAGSGDSDYFADHILHSEMAGQINMWEASTSNNKDALATKAAYLLGLTGPANSINTACSTGLVSVVEACKNLQLGACNLALAGGVSLNMPYENGYIYEEGMILSKDGHCRVFDKEATGTIGGSGVGVVLLKRLDDAIRDGDPVLGVIKGYATNNDGARKTGYTAPSVTGQSECIIHAQAMAGVTASQVEYVECHGTGTNLGDPIEVQALKEAFQYQQPKLLHQKKKTVLGAVKANIGHTDSAAGTAGLIKVVAMLAHHTIPAQVNFNIPNPELHLEQSGFEVLKENREWLPEPGKQRVAGVSSFGIGGTNAHIIVGDYLTPAAEINETNAPADTPEDRVQPARYIIPFTAKSRKSLEAYKQAFVQYLEQAKENSELINLRNIAYTLQERREHFNFRAAYTAQNAAELISKIKDDSTYAEINTEYRNKKVFMFPGQGVQYPQMAKALYNNDEQFSNTVNQCIALANQHLAADLFEVMYPAGEASVYDIHETQWTQISLFIIEYALAKYLEHQGVQADAYIGHSIGEYVAATLCGVFSLPDAIKIVIERGKLMQRMQPGSMLIMNATEEAVKNIVKKYDCEIAVINSPEDIVASGTHQAIKLLHEALEKEGISAIKLNTSHAYHSRMMEDAANEFKKVFANVTMKKPAKLFISNVTGEIAGDEVLSPGYWAKQLRNTVQFAKGISKLCKQFAYQVSFIEAGTGKGLCSFVNKYKNTAGNKSVRTVQLLPTAKESVSLNGAAPSFQNITDKHDLEALLWMNGIIPDANTPALLKQAKLQTNLPHYQFDHHVCWLERTNRPETKKINAIDELFYTRSWERTRVQPGEAKNPEHQHILVLVSDAGNDNSKYDRLLNVLTNHYHYITCISHREGGEDSTGSSVDFSNTEQLTEALNKATANNPIGVVLYLSSSINPQQPALDIFAVKNLFKWAGSTGNEISAFISVSLNNYEVTGSEILEEKPSVIYGVTKSIPFEYFTSGTRAFHIDIALQDDGYEELLPAVLSHQNGGKDLFAVRGKYLWFPTYQQLSFEEPAIKATNGVHAAAKVYLITGGLGGVGYAFAEHIAEKEEEACTLILLGRTPEHLLREDYQTRLNDLRETGHEVIYQAMDIGSREAITHLEKLFTAHGIEHIEMALHTAGVAAKSALHEKTNADIEQVISPKITGTENLLTLARLVTIKNMVCCSSVSSIVPSLGNMEYTAANLYLDEISQRKQPGIKNMLTINLNQVADTGMAVDFLAGSSSGEGRSSDSIMSYEFPAIVETLLAHKAGNNIALSRYDLNTEISENYKSLSHLDSDLSGSDGSKIHILENGYNDTEFQIAQVFGDILGVEEISLHDDFFKLGGNSIHAIQLSHRVSKILGCELRVADVFKYKTIAQMQHHKTGETQTAVAMGVVEKSVLSFAQERLWFIEQYEQGSNAYHIPVIYELNPETDAAGMKYALRQIVNRHEVLRSTIEQDETGEQGIQRVHHEPLSFEETILNATDDLSSQIEADINEPFDLSTEYPIRVKFYTIQSAEDAPSRTLLLINTHHIASDGWSGDIFENELFAFYEAYVNNDTAFALPPLEIQYKDYAVWQRGYLTGEVLEQQLNYWKEKLTGFQTLELPTDFPRPAEIDYTGGSQVFNLGSETTRQLRTLAQQLGVTLNSILLSAIDILMSKYSGQDDIVIGSVIANRHHRQTEGLIGFFVNTQVNRAILNPTQSFEELVQQVQQEQIQAQLYQDLPFEKLVDELDIERDAARHPVFQVMFGLMAFARYEKTAVNEPAEDEQQMYLKPFQSDVSYEVEKFDMSFIMYDNPEAIHGHISYATALFRRESIEQMIHHFIQLLNKLVEQPQMPYSQISLPGPDEYRQIVYDWNAPVNNDVPDTTIPEQFEKNVAKHPDKIALTYNNQSLTYRALNEKANQLAHHIREQYQLRTHQPLAPGTLIALYLNRSLEMIIGILAVLKAGGAYVPLDINYPQDRIDYLLADTGAELVVSQQPLTERNQIQLPANKVVYADLSEPLYDTMPVNNLPVCCASADLAYIIYTSGTTGKPKGVMVEHRHLLQFVMGNNYINYDKVGVVAAISNYAFDGSIFDIFFPLLNGRQLVVVDNSYLSDISVLEQALKNNRADTAFFTTALFNTLVQNQSECFNGLLQVSFGGEACNREIVNRFKNKYPNTALIHAYGPTENIVYSTACNLSEYDTEHLVPIGKRLADKYLYVLDKYLNPVPPGVTGELYIGGPGLSRGYLNRPDLTEERFLPNPFASASDHEKGFNRFYKTGDLVRWLSNGYLDFAGRNDDQVKINGYRIEPEEIETALTQIAGLKQSCVQLKERATNAGTAKYLVAYYVPETEFNEKLTPAVIAEQLSQLLPEYMVPAAYVEMESIPLTVNGKLDKGALPDPDLSALAEEFEAPATDTETTVCKIWQEILGLQRVGITDNFFKIGGNSILAIQVSYRMSRALGTDVKVADVFKLKTIQGILGNITIKQVDPDNVEWDISINTESAQDNGLVKPYYDTPVNGLNPLIFIHPGHGGSEVYQQLADQLSEAYNCIGIDNYNLHHTDKISSLNKLAARYLSDYEQKYSLKEPLYLAGWSLGGQIALEMASILESRGYRHIRVLLLDSFLRTSETDGIDKRTWDDLFRKLLQRVTFDQDHIDKLTAAAEAERKLVNSFISACLEHTEVVLFKSTKEEEGTEEITPRFLKKLQAGIMGSVAKKLELISLNCSHYDIIETCSEQIISYLLPGNENNRNGKKLNGHEHKSSPVVVVK